MRKIFLLLSIVVISFLLFSCLPKPEVMEEKTAETQEMPASAAAKTISDAEVEADLEKLSLEDLNVLIESGEKEKDKPLSEQAYENPDWLTLAYKVKAEKLAEQTSDSGAVATNHAPVFKEFSNKDGAENEELKFTVSAMDEDGDSLMYEVKDDPPGADLSKTGKFSWTPDYDDAGSYEVTFVVSDGKTTATKTITVTIANTNRLPKFSGEWEAINQLVITVNDKEKFYLEATDADGDALQYGIKTNAEISNKINKTSGELTLFAAGVEPLGFPLTLTISDGTDTVEKMVTALAFPASCVKNTECPASYRCGSSDTCTLWNLADIKYSCTKGMNSTTAQKECADEAIVYWTDDTKGHNLCYKVDPDVTLNSCVVTKPTTKYKYDCSFTATCDYSSLN